MDNRIDQDILSRFVNTLCRFGREDAPYWFVGLEEGGGGDEREIAARLSRWAASGYSELSYLSNSGFPHPDHKSDAFLPGPGKRAKLQTTWSNQLRVVLGIRGTPLNNELIRRMQVSEHGSPNGDTSLLELFPLPCKSANAWPYGKWGLGDAYAKKSTYRQKFLNSRLELIFASAEAYQPKAIIFTTWTYRSDISRHVPSMETVAVGSGNNPGKAMIGRINDSVVAVCTHPGHRFSDKNAFYWSLGREIASRFSIGAASVRKAA